MSRTLGSEAAKRNDETVLCIVFVAVDMMHFCKKGDL